MRNSLQEQLLTLGLVDKSKAQQVKKEQRKQARIPSANTDAVAKAVAQATADKAQRDRELNRQKEQKQAAKARKALLRQFIEQNRLNDHKADQTYNFIHGSNIKRIYVTKQQKEKLIAGKLAIVQFDDRYAIVELETATKIHDLSPDHFVFIAQPEQPKENDPYAEFQVPDDLIW